MKCRTCDARVSERHVTLRRVCDKKGREKPLAVYSCPTCGATSSFLPIPDQLRTWAILAKATTLHAQGRLQEALGCFEHILSINREFALAWYNKGCVLGSLGRYQEALKCYERSLAIDPQDARGWHNKGCALRALGRGLEPLLVLTAPCRRTPNRRKPGPVRETFFSPQDAIKKPCRAMRGRWQLIQKMPPRGVARAVLWRSPASSQRLLSATTTPWR